jgi:probable DNA repair protein
MGATRSQAELLQLMTEVLDRGWTVITANQRSARGLRYAFDQRNRNAGLANWQPANVLHWDGWTAALWQNLLVDGQASELLLSRAQEHTIWRSILTADTGMAASLQSPDSLAELTSDAWRTLVRYNGEARLRGSWNSSETKALQRWGAEFERRCRTQSLLPKASLEQTLSKAFEGGRLRVSAPIALLGFDEFSPAQQSFIKSISASGTQIEELRTELAATQKALVQTRSEIEEIKSAAWWARRHLEENPEMQIAVIVPSLEQRRNTINRIFREVLSPELEDIQAANNVAAYEFSLGVALSETPMVRVALDLLRWSANPLPVERVSALLVSPLFAMREEERSARATFDALEFRRARLLLPEVPFLWLVNTVRHSKRGSKLSYLSSTLAAMSRKLTETTVERRTHAAWADHIREFLQTAHWGRGVGEDSVEFQTRQKWESTLDELTTLDFDGSRVSFDQALRELARLAHQTMFAPESHRAAIQIMGPLEAAGSRFDAIWFLGVSDLEWPVRSSSNALLPWPLQRDLGIPGGNLSVDEVRALRITDRIASSAAEIVFSYAIESSKGKQRASPLLNSFHLERVPVAQFIGVPEERTPVVLEEFSDGAIASLPDRKMPGGAEILKLQAACGFRAFAERRLGAEELREIELGMDAAERGSIVHRTLEHFWKKIGSQAVLKAMPRRERETSLAESIEYGLRRAVAASKTAWEEAYVDLQRARLWALLDPWLDLELQRSPFTVKFSEEDAKDVSIGPLRLDLRIDRIDVTDEGEIILDYKTGGAKAAQWQGERPDEPQLPLYAVLTAAAEPEIPLIDVAFAQIRAGKEMAYESFNTKISGIKKSEKRRGLSFEEQLVEWRRVLENLAVDFHNGDARVDPKNYPMTCNHCAQRVLCRLNPAAFDEDLDEEATFDSANG